jgi:broad specificity phosphatase PhoE
MRLTLVRHGETPANVRGSLDTAVPGPGLTKRGHAQAKALVQRFAEESFDSIFVSAMRRSRLTAAPLAKSKRLSPHQVPDLSELSVGPTYEARRDAPAIAFFVDVMRRWLLGDHDAAFPGGESGHQILARMDAAMDLIADSGARHPVAISHGGVMRVWATARCDNIDPDFAVSSYVVNTGVIVVSGGPGAWHCESWDEVPAHHRTPATDSR